MASVVSNDVSVRIATRHDMPVLHKYIHDLAEYEGMPDGPQLSVEDLIHDGFDSTPSWFFVLVAELKGKIVGAALCNRAYSSWTRRSFYIEDLYVEKECRRAGVASKLLQRLCQLAVEEEVNRIDWHVLESNEPALVFYARLGARDLAKTEKRAAMRLDRHRIEAVAKGNLLPKP